jgi:hypothetical protein
METHSQQTKPVNGYTDKESAPDARDFLGSRYLSKDDLDGPTVVCLQNVRPELLPGARRRKLVAEFRNEEKGLILNATNIKRLAKMFGTTDTSHWRGDITVYVDPDVEYAGTPIGGIRVNPAPHNGNSERPANSLAQNGF